MDSPTAHRHRHQHSQAHDACCGGAGAAAAAVAAGTPFRIATMDCAAEEAEIRNARPVDLQKFDIAS